MSYADPGYGDDARFRGEPGFREEADFRSDPPPSTGYASGAYPVTRYVDGTSTDTTSSTRPVTAAELDDVFDDPEHGQRGMDRMGVHVAWEVILLVGVLVVGFFLKHDHSAAITGDNLKVILLDAASLGLVCTGLALSLRAGAVNLAVGAVAAAGGVYYAQHSGGSVLGNLGVIALLAAGAGAAVALVIVIFQVPPWAATLAAALAVVVWLQKRPDVVPVTGYDPAKHAIYWYAGFAGLSVLGGLLGLFKPVRRGVARFRPVADPAQRRGVAGAVVVILALAGSSLLAGLGGALAAMANRGADTSDGGILVTAFALAVVLCGGTSAFGRRGGIFGTLLAATLLVLFVDYGLAANWRMSPYAVAAGAIGIGLVVTRLVESLGKPRSAADSDDDGWGGGLGRDSGWGSSRQQGTWGSQLPARSIDDTWGGASDERWGAR